ncbi:MAG: hypothetical protein R8M11_03625 [Gallionella sp.]
MKRLFSILVAVMITLSLSGCSDSGSPADPPSDFTAAAGDGRVKVTWTSSLGVEYWLFTATDPSLTAFNFAGLSDSIFYIPAASPFYLCGLNNGTPYFFAINGRTNDGPGGPSSPTLSATPYNTSATWTAGSTVAPLPNLFGVGYTSLNTCTNNSNSATGSFAAVGTAGAIFTSNDGINWDNQATPLGFMSDLYAVAGYAANQNNPSNPALSWVAVGAGGASIYSSNGIDWHQGRADLGNPSLRSLMQVSGIYYAAGDNGTIEKSINGGMSWEPPLTPITTNNLNGISYGISYLAVGDLGTILTSSDGDIWDVEPPAIPATTANLRHVTSIGTIMVAVGDAGTIVTSIDSGVTWTTQILAGVPNLVSVAAQPHLVSNAVADPLLGYISNAQIVAIDSAGNAYTSTNGLTWIGPISTGIASANALVSSGFGFVATGNAGETAYAF